MKVTHSRVRRKRMGHINLAAPIVHIWFFKAMPSRLGNLLDMKTSDLEKVVYYQDYMVVDPGTSTLKRKQLLTEEEYRDAREKFGDELQGRHGRRGRPHAARRRWTWRRNPTTSATASPRPTPSRRSRTSPSASRSSKPSAIPKTSPNG